MHIFKTKEDLSVFINKGKSENKSIGFVPTMGALHNGHLSLVNSSIDNNDITVVSIFVNPTQFDNPEDLLKYPNTVEKDIELLDKEGVTAVFLPTVEVVYGVDIVVEKYDFGNLDTVMEGKYREGHFDGVATIVRILFELVSPTNSYFGEKDFQQLQIVKKMVSQKGLDTNIVSCPIVRENDGLAMSSRNIRLDEIHRQEASFIYSTLQKASGLSKTESLENIKKYVEESFAKNNFMELEYFEIRDEEELRDTNDFQSDTKYRGFVAVTLQNIRLIDNIRLF